MKNKEVQIISHSKPLISKQDKEAVAKLLRSGMIAQGRAVKVFEGAVARYIGVKYCVAVNSGSSALILALKALGIGVRDEVMLPTYVCKSVIDCIFSVGAIPVLCDIDDDWNISYQSVQRSISDKTKALIIPYLFGIAKDMRPFKTLKIPLIEDCCQAFGASINRRKVGTFGALSFFSFHATKCLTTGEGGMCCSDNEDLIHAMRELRDGNLRHVQERLPYMMTDVQAALGLSQLSQYPVFLKKRKKIAERYFKAFERLPFDIPHRVKERSIFFRFPIIINRDVAEVIRMLEHKRIYCRRGVDNLLHRLLNLSDREFPKATVLFNHTLSLPIYPALTEAEQNRIISSIRQLQ